MYVFHYDKETLAYTGGAPVDVDQKAPGEVLVPAWASKVPPPSYDGATQLPFYLPASDSWEVREVAYEPVLAEPLEPEPAPAPTIEDLRASLASHLAQAETLMKKLDDEAAP